jgi:hypothetical protein
MIQHIGQLIGLGHQLGEVLLDFAQPRRLKLSDERLRPCVPLCPIPLQDMSHFWKEPGEIDQRRRAEQVERPVWIPSPE